MDLKQEPTAQEINDSGQQTTSGQIDQETNPIDDDVARMVLEKLANKVVENRNALAATLQYLAEVINNSHLINLNKERSREYVKYLSFLMAELGKQSFEVPDFGAIIQVTEILDIVIELASDAVKSNLTKLAPFDLDKVEQRLQAKDIPKLDSLLEILEYFINQLEKQTAAIEALDKKVKDVGLTRFNKIVRNVAQFSTNHRLLPRLGYAALLGLCGTYIIARLPTETKEIAYTDKIIKKNPFKYLDPRFYLDRVAYNATSNGIPLKLIDPRFYLHILKNSIGDAPVVDNAGILQPFYECITEGKPSVAKYNYKWYADIQHFLENKTGLISTKFAPFITANVVGGYLMSNLFKPTWEKISNTSSAILDIMQGKKVKNNQLLGEQEPRYTFDDIIGQEQAKEVLMRVVNYIRDHEKFDRAGLTPEAGYVLAGPPGTGKTLLAEACAGEIKRNNPDANFRFFPFSAAMAIEFGLENILYLAKREAPCLVFIDEFDLLNLTRGMNDQKLSALLTAMSGTMNEHLNKDNKKQVILLIATNRPQQLDDALKRHGRFGKIVHVKEPTLDDRINFIKSQLDNRAIMFPDSFIHQLAHETEGCVMEDLRSMIKAALQKAKIRGSTVTEKDFEQALDEEIRNIAPANATYGAQEKKLIAIHQIGHALASLLLQPTEQVVKVTLRAVSAKIKEEAIWDRYYKEPQELTEYGKIFTSNYDNSALFKSHDEMRKQCMIHVAGHLAEELVFGSSGYTYHKHDQNKALAIAKYVIFKGLQEKDLPKEVRTEYETQAFAWYQSCIDEMRKLLSAHTQTIMILAEKLMEEETLTADTIKTIIGTLK